MITFEFVTLFCYQDGCDLVCRCGRERDSYLDDRGHRGRSEGLLENASDHVDVDDGLLGM